MAISDKLNDEITKFISKFYLNKHPDELIFKVSEGTIENYFKKVLTISDIKITDKGPRLHDLRHTFVVQQY